MKTATKQSELQFLTVQIFNILLEKYYPVTWLPDWVIPLPQMTRRFALSESLSRSTREGSMSQGPHNRVPIPDAYVKEIIDNEPKRRWNNGWIHTEGHRQTKLFFPEVDTHKAEQLYKVSKSTYSQVVR